MSAELEALRLEHAAWGALLDAARRDRDTARAERDEAQRALAAIEAALLGQPHPADGLSPYAASVVLPLARRIAADLEDARADLEDARRALAAELGQPDGAPDPAWVYDGHLWTREYPDGSRAWVAADGRWYRWRGEGTHYRVQRAIGRRAAMIAADSIATAFLVAPEEAINAGMLDGGKYFAHPDRDAAISAGRLADLPIWRCWSAGNGWWRVIGRVEP